MSERPIISSALGGRPTVPYPNAGTDNNKRPTGQKQQLFDGRTVENKGKLILIVTIITRYTRRNFVILDTSDMISWIYFLLFIVLKNSFFGLSIIGYSQNSPPKPYLKCINSSFVLLPYRPNISLVCDHRKE